MFSGGIVWQIEGAAAPSWFCLGQRKVQVVNRILLEVVQDDVPSTNWKAKISDEALENVVDAWVTYYQRLVKSNVTVHAVTCGSGLFDRLDELDAKLASKGVPRLDLLPSTDYAFAGMEQAVMTQMFGS